MLFGLGEGLGFIYWKMKGMDAPFFGGRIKPDKITENIARNLKLRLNVVETTSKEKAWTGVKSLLDDGKVVGLKLDCYHLEYFSRKLHFAAHYTAMYGYDSTSAYLVDTRQQGGKVKTSLESLRLARAERGPMSSKNLYYTLERKGEFDLNEAILNSIRRNAKDHLNPPIKNIGHKGIEKAGVEVLKWFRGSHNIEAEFSSTAQIMEKAGTGGSLFRNLYRDFLLEASEEHGIKQLQPSYRAFVDIASQWKTVADLFLRIGQSKQEDDVVEVSTVLQEIAAKERNAMMELSKI
jgi:hypothetical protein